MWLYFGLAMLRVLWSAYPQYGYIHPDEFFQTVEVTAGDAFNTTVDKTWEFDDKSPLRSMLINKVLFAPVFYTLYQLSKVLNIVNLNGRVTLCASRLVMVGLSFTLDYSVWTVCRLLNLDPHTGLVLLSGSYVMLTYQTHSFSNSVESALLMIVIRTIIKSICRSSVGEVKEHTKERVDHKEINGDQVLGSVLERENNWNEEKYLGGKGKEKNKLKKHGKVENRWDNSSIRKRKKDVEKEKVVSKSIIAPLVTRHSKWSVSGKSVPGMTKHPLMSVTLTDCLLLALINTAGIFNRPTFALFSITPFIWWCYNMRWDKLVLLKQVSLFTMASLVFAVVFCIFDSCYYKQLSVIQIWNGYISMKDLVLTPWNFVKYNTVISNLEKHGRHPVYLHFLVNLPLLFGPLALILFTEIFSKISDGFKNMWTFFSLTKMDRVKKQRQKGTDMHTTLVSKHLLFLFIVTPVVFLSVFPHQEPRFLIPLLPLVILYSLHTLAVFSKLTITFFSIFNLTLAVLYGILHQGGVIPCLFRLQELSTLDEYSSVNTTVLFSHTYMPPKHLLLLNETSKVTVMDLRGSDHVILQDTISTIHRQWGYRNSKINKLLLVIPGTVWLGLKTELKSKFDHSIVEQFHFHLTLEDPPKLITEPYSVKEDPSKREEEPFTVRKEDPSWKIEDPPMLRDDPPSLIRDGLKSLFSQLSLYLIQIHLG